jgi:hypothetical protein
MLNVARNQVIGAVDWNSTSIQQYASDFAARINAVKKEVAAGNKTNSWQLPLLTIARQNKIAAIVEALAKSDAAAAQAKLDAYYKDQNLDIAWYNAETQRINALKPTGGSGGTGGGGTGGGGTGGTVYDPKSDLSIMSNSGADPDSINLANLRLTAGTGVISDANLSTFMDGQDYYFDTTLTKPSWVAVPTTGAPRGTTTYHFTGLMGVDSTPAEQIIHSVADPVRQASLAIIYGNKGLKDAPTSWYDAMQSFMNDNSTKVLGADGYDFSTNEIAALELILIHYYGTKP